jgi:hypothetical protein
MLLNTFLEAALTCLLPALGDEERQARSLDCLGSDSIFNKKRIAGQSGYFKSGYFTRQPDG